MKLRSLRSSGAELACEICGQWPHPHKFRLTLANLAAMLPIELAVHAAVMNTGMPYLQKVLALTLTATVLLAAARSGGGRNVLAWRTTALAVADGQTKALSLAVRVAGNPGPRSSIASPPRLSCA